MTKINHENTAAERMVSYDVRIRKEAAAKEAFLNSIDEYDQAFIFSVKDQIQALRELDCSYRNMFHSIPLSKQRTRSGLDALKKKFGANYKYLKEHYGLYINDEDNRCPFKQLEKLTVYHNGEEIPFLSEGFLYEVVGKDSARSILGLFDAIKQSIGKI